MIAPIQPGATYDSGNEAQFRTQIRQEDLRNLKRDEALPYLTMLNDDGSVYRGTLVGGVLTWSPA